MSIAGTRTVTIQVGKGQQVAARRQPDPCTMVIFGATGDLTSRKLIPSLYRLERAGLLPFACSVTGFARRDWSDDHFRATLEEAAKKFLPAGFYDPKTWRRFAMRLSFVSGSFDDADAYGRLLDRLEENDRVTGTGGNRLLYLSTAPSAFPEILGRLRPAGLIHPPGNKGGPWTRVVIEKPFGRDLESAKALNRQVHEVLDESQIYRIDHYLGKETVQNILVFRFGNAIFEPLWNRKYIDHVQITASEKVGVEGRGKFYDETGVLRDLVQNHLLQVLALCAMEPPLSFDADDIRDQTAQVLHALRPLDADAVRTNTVRAQYQGWAEEPGVAPGSRTPTYTALRMHLDTWRWHGVPFYLRTGKALSAKDTEVAIQFQSVPMSLFGSKDAVLRVAPNTLVLRIQPDEGISLGFSSKVPGDDLAIGTVDMDFKYEEVFGGEPPEAYQRLLLDCMRGDPTLFIRSDSVLRSWEYCTPILKAWDADRASPIPVYEKGSAGPAEADRLLADDRRRLEGDFVSSGANIEVLPAAEFTARAAQRLSGLISEAVRAGGRASVALAGGSTPKPVYELLGAKPLRTTIPWLGVSWWFGDERCVPPDHADSNFRMVRAALFEPVGVPDARIHRLEGEREDRDAAARDYEKNLPEAIDLLILGIGDDGHTASLFPGSPAVAETRRRVVAAESPAGASWRLTITRPVIAAAKRIVVLAAGAAKAAAVARAIEGPRDPRTTPAQLAARDGALWILDDAAAARLRPESFSGAGGGGKIS